MKLFFAFALSMFAVVPAFASLTAPEALEQILDLRVYNGQTPEGESCSVLLTKKNSGVQVTAIFGYLQISVSVKKDSFYRWQPGQRYFLNSEKVHTSDDEYVETTFMTRSINETTQYMVVESMTADSSTRAKTTIECEVSL